MIGFNGPFCRQKAIAGGIGRFELSYWQFVNCACGFEIEDSLVSNIISAKNQSRSMKALINKFFRKITA